MRRGRWVAVGGQRRSSVRRVGRRAVVVCIGVVRFDGTVHRVAEVGRAIRGPHGPEHKTGPPSRKDRTSPVTSELLPCATQCSITSQHRRKHPTLKALALKGHGFLEVSEQLLVIRGGEVKVLNTTRSTWSEKRSWSDY